VEEATPQLQRRGFAIIIERKIMNALSSCRVGLICPLLLVLLSAQSGPESVVRGTKQFSRTVLVSGMGGPWELTWGPDRMLWVTERTGKRVTRVNPTTGERKVAITIGEVAVLGAQDGLLGMALHPELLRGTGNDFVYVAYSYVDEAKGPNPEFPDAGNMYHFLYTKIVRLTYDANSGTLSNPVNIITGLPAGNDHQAGRLKIGPDGKLYLSKGDQGNDQLGNYCTPIQAQRLPTQQELSASNYISYVGKTLRLNLDGTIPADNPVVEGVRSHIYTYGHRNPQGIDFGPDGTLYSSEHGPKTDDEINILKPGANYGWPHVAGLKDGKAYEYARWAESSTPCAQIRFSDIVIPPTVPRQPESAFTKPFTEPIATMFTVASDYNFQDAVCKGNDFICWPTVGASSLEYYASKPGTIPGWDRVLLVTTLKRGSLYVIPLSANGQAVTGTISRYFQSDNRYRDIAVHPDGKTLYIATDESGQAEAMAGGTTRQMQDRGAILVFTYTGEGTGVPVTEAPRPAQPKPAVAKAKPAGPTGPPPKFTAAQSTQGRTAYDANCAACHGNTLTNGTFAPPLAGESFKSLWSGQNVRPLYDKAKAMPPSAPASLPDATYANIVSYILETNGARAGNTSLPAGGEPLEGMRIP
jgi:PQQ-dependent dehydrogenase (s-GDH family)